MVVAFGGEEWNWKWENEEKNCDVWESEGGGLHPDLFIFDVWSHASRRTTEEDCKGPR